MRIDNSGNVGVGITNAETGAGLILPAAAFTISRPAPTVATADTTATTNFTPTELLRLQLTDNNSGTPNQAIGSGIKMSFYNNGDNNPYGSVDSMYEMASISGIKLQNLDNNYAGGLVFCTHTDVGNTAATAAATERMRIIANGNVGIGTIAPAYKLDVNGDVQAVSYNATSDYRIKDCVLSLPDCSFVVDPLRPVSYRNKLTNKQDIGLIAHEVQEHFPFFVNGEKDGEHNQSINYTGFIALLIHEIQQLKQRVSDLEKQANK